MKYRFTESAEVLSNLDHPALFAEINPKATTKSLVVDSEKLQGRQDITMTVFSAAKPTSLIICPVAWAANGKSGMTQWRAQVMAEVLDAQVVVLDFPGMSERVESAHNGLTEKQIEQIRKTGSFAMLGRNYWDAIQLSDNGIDKKLLAQNTILWGDSMGWPTAVGLLAETPGEPKIKGVVALEAAGLGRLAPRPMGSIALAAAFGVSSIRLGKYQNMNPKRDDMPIEPIYELPGRIMQDTGAYSAPVAAMAKGQSTLHFVRALKQDRAYRHLESVHIINGTDDLVSPLGANIRLEALSREAKIGRVSHTLMQNEGHGVPDSLPALIALLEKYKKYIN